jgi:hypothetical protein
MNKLRAAANLRGTVASVLKTISLAALSVTLGAAFWMASLPLAMATNTTPAEMIQANLPQSMSLGSAPKAQMLAAICQAVSKSPKDAPQIVRTAAGSRKELSSDITATAVRCLKGDAKEGTIDCGLIRSTLHASIAVNPEEGAALTESVMGLAPGCLDSPEEGPGDFSSAVTNINPGSVGGSAAAGEVCTVCHNNQPVQVACAKVANYLQSHPGDTAGACAATPDSNQ